ncbi:TolB-like 6-bladed beta-propeller domain-containing protein [Algoriphagus marincola]|uniref:TolB-like 6-bladed beta-propeller domain-containing protein n=1 Tax=Algoriphagus marincola TaxID=264027 RepID=A0ABS7N7B2_9BACT|nr:BF3164 family lipoprotein [Algoriphagus marincola]MBY5952226.1 TolB-like 6-bladed beta-propeller domain-containing protein [Algoriphagus marincola]
MKNSLLFSFVVLISLFVSCSKKVELTDPLEEFDRSRKLSALPLSSADSLFRAWNMYLVEDKLLINDDGLDYIYRLIDPVEDRYLGKFGRSGQGPCELSASVFLNRYGSDGENMGIYDGSQIRFQSFPVSSLEDSTQTADCEPYLFPINGLLRQFVKLDSIRFLASSLDGGQPYNLYFKAENVQSLGAYPFQDDFPAVPAMNLALAYQFIFFKNPKSPKTLSTSYYSFNMDVLELNKNGDLELSASRHYWPTLFDPSENSSRVSSTILPDAVFGNISSAVSADKIYVLYNDLPWNNDLFQTSSRILVYDWDLNPIEILELDQEVSRIAVHEDDNYLVGYVDDGKANLFRFDLR